MDKIRNVLSRAAVVFHRYPMVLCVAFFAAAATNVYIRRNYLFSQDFALLRFIISSCLGISVMFALKMLSERIGKEILLQILGIIFLVGFYFILPEKQQDFTDKYAFVIFPTALLTHLFVSFSAFLGRNKEINFWQFNKNLFVNLFLTAVFTGVLTGGVELAIAAAKSLFELDFNDQIFMQVFWFMAIFGSCFIFLLFSSEGISGLENGTEYPVILKFFTQFILIPLLFLYAVILYLYSAKILIKWELPRGWVSLMILAYAVVGILALLLVHPLKEYSAKSWVKSFGKVFYYSLLPLLILLFTAIFTRFLEYGFTEPRYFVLMLGIWLSAVVLYFIFIKKPTIKFIPVSLFAFGLFSLIFPYFNAFSVSKRSQKSELQKILSENKILQNGKIDFKTPVTSDVTEEISNKFKFLKDRGEEKFLLNFLPENTKKEFKNNNEFSFYIGNKFENITYKNHNSENEMYHFFTLKSEQILFDIKGYNQIIDSDEMTDVQGYIGKEKVLMDNYKSTLTIGGETWDYGKDAEKIIARYPQRDGSVNLPEISATHEFKKYRTKLVFRSISRNNASLINLRPAFILVSEK